MKRYAFTLIELLVVIAIIAILAAIAFPVIARAKDSAYRSSDLNNMNSLRSSLQIYRVDQGAYPPALLGYATLYSSGPNAGQVIPAHAIQSFLYPRRVTSFPIFQPSYEKAGPRAITQAVWPNQDPRAAGTAPLVDTNGDGALTAADDDGCGRQQFGPTTTVTRRDPISGLPVPAEFYTVSGYDVARTRIPGGGSRNELRYALFWSFWAIGSDPGCSPSGTPGNALDDPRQLGYSEPPENTVITWNSYFRDYANDAVTHTTRDIVLFLGGAAKPYDSADVFERSWRILP
jgi:prepilin-type N-terminal cleavage/methylation domain-containing protein